MYHLQVSLLSFYIPFLSFHLFHCSLQSVLPNVTANLSPKALNLHLWKVILPWLSEWRCLWKCRLSSVGGRRPDGSSRTLLQAVIPHPPCGKGELARPRVVTSVYVLELKINVGMICSAVVFSVQFVQVLSILIYNMFIKAKINVFSRKWHHMIFFCFFLALHFVRNSVFRLWLSSVNLWIIWRETHVKLCFDVSSSHVFSGVCLGMEGNAASCDSEPELVQTKHTKQKPGGGAAGREKANPSAEICFMIRALGKNHIQNEIS